MLFLTLVHVIVQIPDIAKMSLSNPGNSGGQSVLVNSLGNSTGGVSVNNSGGVDLSASLATSRVLASNNLAAQQVNDYARSLLVTLNPAPPAVRETSQGNIWGSS